MLRTVRLVRLFRIFKLGRYSSGMRLVAQALMNSFQALWVLVFFLWIGIFLFSSLLYYAEKMYCPNNPPVGEMSAKMREEYAQECDPGSPNGVCPTYGLCCDEYDSPLDFPSIPSAFWWSVVTMTTVGFGDVYPKTGAGKVVGVFSMLMGILLIALPVAIVGRKFQEVYDVSEEERAAARRVEEEQQAQAAQDGEKNKVKRWGSASLNLSSYPTGVAPGAKSVAESLRDMKFTSEEFKDAACGLAVLSEEAEQIHESLKNMGEASNEKAELMKTRLNGLLDRIKPGGSSSDGGYPDTSKGFQGPQSSIISVQEEAQELVETPTLN